MSVKTKFSKKDFNEILSNYNIGECKKYKSLRLDSVQTNLLLETTQGKFVFKYYGNRSEKYALFELDLLQYLSKHSYPCPTPVRNNQARFVGAYKNKPFAIFALIEGEHRKNVDPKLIVQAIGGLHKITLNYKPKYSKARENYDSKSCWENAKLNSKKIKSESEAEERLNWLKTELDKLKLPKNLPKGTCHCDTHPSNFLYKNGELVAVLDFDDASYIHLLYDVANIIYFWAWPHKNSINFDVTKTILKEYNNYRNLTVVEKNHLYDFLKMVIFMSIGWFIYNDDDYYTEKRKIEFLNSIGRRGFYKKVF